MFSFLQIVENVMPFDKHHYRISDKNMMESRDKTKTAKDLRDKIIKINLTTKVNRKKEKIQKLHEI